MKERHKKDLVSLTGDKINFDRPMDKYNTWHVGGKCEALYTSNDMEELGQVIGYLNREGIPYFIVGRGSNLLVKDNGIDGLVILLNGSLATVEQPKEDGTLSYVGLQ